MEERRRHEKECFGLPYGGAIVGIMIGIIIIISGISWLLDIDLWANIGPLMAIIFGILIVAGVAYGLTRR
ncbi:MAG: hypothetical protein JSV57_00950 [Candidatus Bathyarchaeota archaeon]|nr:MAG: hypothetical protein JSV57_00950 [Candidatus Bathyarchaeota archaeon]